jgi:hypothetical protein
MRSSKPGQANVQEGCARTAASSFSERTNSDQATVQNPSLKYQASCGKSSSIVWRPSASAHVMKQAVKALRSVHPYEQVVVEVTLLVDISDFQDIKRPGLLTSS